MLKVAKLKLLGKEVSITKLSANAALRSHAKVISFVSPSIGDIIEGAGKEESEQMSKMVSAITKAFSETADIDGMVAFIEDCICDGNVAFDGKRVQDLDDLDRFDDIDGSELMYLIFTEWCILNLGGLLKKIGSRFTG